MLPLKTKRTSKYKQCGSGKRYEELLLLQKEIDNANRLFILGTFVELSYPYDGKKTLNYWVSNSSKAADVLEYNKLPKSEQFERAYKELKKDKILHNFMSSLTPYSGDI